jgi:hypothetical protein
MTPHFSRELFRSRGKIALHHGGNTNENSFEADKMLHTKEKNLLKLLPTMHGLLRQKRMRWVGHALRQADGDLSKVEVKKEMALSSKSMDKLPVGRHEGAQHQGHKSFGRHFQEKGTIP